MRISRAFTTFFIESLGRSKILFIFARECNPHDKKCGIIKIYAIVSPSNILFIMKKTKYILLLMVLSLTVNLFAQSQRSRNYYDALSWEKKHLLTVFKKGANAEKNGDYKTAATDYEMVCASHLYPPALYAMGELIKSKKDKLGERFKKQDYDDYWQKAAAQGHPSLLWSNVSRVTALLIEQESMARHKLREYRMMIKQGKSVNFDPLLQSLQEWIDFADAYQKAYSQGRDVWKKRKLKTKDFYPVSYNGLAGEKKSNKHYFKNPENAIRDFEKSSDEILTGFLKLRNLKLEIQIEADHIKQNKLQKSPN
jgi:hypothetical protein